MSANFAAVDALTGFLRGIPEAPESDLEKLGVVLARAGDKGLSMAEAMAASALSRPRFLEALINGTKAGLFEKASTDAAASIRLSEQGKSIY